MLRNLLLNFNPLLLFFYRSLHRWTVEFDPKLLLLPDDCQPNRGTIIALKFGHSVLALNLLYFSPMEDFKQKKYFSSVRILKKK